MGLYTFSESVDSRRQRPAWRPALPLSVQDRRTPSFSHAMIVGCISRKRYPMKEAIHPKYFDVDARCACGATWKTRSTKPELHLEICANCHPFFTGKQKLMDTEGRVERFNKKFGAQTSESRKAAAKAKKDAPAAAR